MRYVRNGEQHYIWKCDILRNITRDMTTWRPVDCLHYTRRVYQNVACEYDGYMTEAHANQLDEKTMQGLAILMANYTLAERE